MMSGVEILMLSRIRVEPMEPGTFDPNPRRGSSFGYSSDSYRNNPPTRRCSKSVPVVSADCVLGQYVDFLVPMVYEITGSAKIHSRSSGEATAVPTLVGISAFDFSGYEQLGDTTAALGESFKDEGTGDGV